MATYYVDKYASGANTGASWADAKTGVGLIDNITGITGNDTVLIKSYGPDDPYTDKDTDSGGRYINASPISGIVVRGDDGQGDASIPSPKMAYIEGDGATLGAAYGRGKFYYLALVGMTTGFHVDSSLGSTTILSHCRTIGCSSYGLYSSNAGNIIVEYQESYNDSKGVRFAYAGVTFLVDHSTFYGCAGDIVELGSTCSAGSVTIRNIIHLSGVSNSIDFETADQAASGWPDYIHTDIASHDLLYDPNTIAVGPHNVFGVTAANYLPFAPYGILYPVRGFPGTADGHDGLDVGAHHQEYGIECRWGYSCDIDDGVPTRAEGQATQRVGLSTTHWRTIIRFNIGNLPAGIKVIEAWVTLYINTLSTGAAAFALYPYAGLGYTQDPETDGDSSLANAYGWADDGPSSPYWAWIADAASTGSTGQKAYQLDPDTINYLIEEARQKQKTTFSIGIRQQDETVDDFLVDGTGSATAARRPRLIVVYSPSLSECQKLRSARNMLHAVIGSVG